MTFPDDPATTRSWSDAHQVDIPAREVVADVLDAWLEQRSADDRAGAFTSTTPVESPSFGPNGEHGTAIPEADAGPLPLTSVAERFHTRLDAAERAAAPDVPESAIWEKIMANHLALESSVPISRPHSALIDQESEMPPRPIRAIAGSHPAFSVLLAAAVVIAMIALFRGISDNGNVAAPAGPTELNSDHNHNHNHNLAALASPSPVANGTPGSARCTVRTLTPVEVGKLRDQRLAAPSQTYLPVQGPASGANSSAAIATYGDMLSCRLPSGQSADRTTLTLWTDRYFADRSLEYPTDSRIVIREQRLAASQQLSAVLVDQDPTQYIVDANDPAIQPYLLRTPWAGNTYVLLTQDFVVLADGRIGAPVKLAFPGGTTGYTKDDYTTPQSVQFLFFAEADGRWRLDQSISLCTWKCDQFYSNEQAEIDQDRQWIASRRAASPVASPQAAISPGAADPWLQPITADECAAVMPDEGSDIDAVATTARHVLACGRYGTLPDDVLPFYSPDFLAAHPEVMSNQFTVRASDVEDARAISNILIAEGNYQFQVRGIPGDDATDATQGFYEVFLPESAIRLEDGRIAIPVRPAMTSDDALNAAATAQANETDVPQNVAMYVFAPVDGAWKVDQQLMLCLKNGEEFWRQTASTPMPIPSPISASTAQQPCITVLAEDDIPALVQESTQWPAPEYAPTKGPAARADARAATANYVALMTCPTLRDAPMELQARNLQTDRMTLASYEAYSSNEGYIRILTQSLELSRELSPLLLDPDPAAYIVEEADLSGSDAVVLSQWNSERMQQVIFPEDFVILADGRIGVPLKSITPGAQNDSSANASPPYQSVAYIVFAQVDGAWLIDQSLTLCTGDCDPFYAELQHYIDAIRALPPATPDAGHAALPKAVFRVTGPVSALGVQQGDTYKKQWPICS